MIYHVNSLLFALSADGSIWRWNVDSNCGQEKVNSLEYKSFFESDFGKLIAISSDKRIYRRSCLDFSDSFVDITDAVCSCIDFDLTEEVIDRVIYCYDSYAFISGHKIGIIYEERGLTIAFDADIDLASFDRYCGFVRTVDDNLHLVTLPRFFDKKARQSSHEPKSILVPFPDTKSILEIHYEANYALFLMEEGDVYTAESKLDQIRFYKISSKEDNIITKIIATQHGYFLITDRGSVLCGYNLKSPKQFECDLAVEDIFVLGYRSGIALIHDNGQVSLFLNDNFLVYNLYEGAIDIKLLNITFPGEQIKTITNIGNDIYFAMDSGQVYLRTIDGNIQLVPFFSENPIALPSGPMRIPSARSILADSN